MSGDLQTDPNRARTTENIPHMGEIEVNLEPM
jgi:hypothetical protein